MRTRKSTVALAAVVLIGLATSGSAVNLSRYRLTLTVDAGSGSPAEALDLGIVRRFCRDEDGCEVILRYESYNELDLFGRVLRILRVRLTLTPDDSAWSIDNPSIQRDDDDGSEDSVLEYFPFGNYGCILSDAEPNGNDHAQGYSLQLIEARLQPLSHSKCTLTLAD
jgi:hypothetical protein